MPRSAAAAAAHLRNSPGSYPRLQDCNDQLKNLITHELWERSLYLSQQYYTLPHWSDGVAAIKIEIRLVPEEAYFDRNVYITYLPPNHVQCYCTSAISIRIQHEFAVYLNAQALRL